MDSTGICGGAAPGSPPTAPAQLSVNPGRRGRRRLLGASASRAVERRGFLQGARLVRAAWGGGAGLALALTTAAWAATDAESSAVFGTANVLRLKIELPKEGLRALRAYQWEGDASKLERPVVQATVREGDRVYTNVAVQLKGGTGSFRPVDDNPSFTLNFDRFAKGQKFHGLGKISLNNAAQDPSFLSENIGRELFLAAGVPVPRAGFAQLELNGRNLGLRVVTEGYDKLFLKRHFGSAKGNFYEGGFHADIDNSLTVNSGDRPEDLARVEALIAAAKEPDLAQRFTRMSRVLDVDRFIRFLAMEVLLVHWDGYAVFRNNYRLFDDLGRGRLVFMPHGMDELFGVRMAGPDHPLEPQMNGMVAVGVLATEQGRTRYHEQLVLLASELLRVEQLTNRVAALVSRIRPVIAESGAGAAREHERASAAFVERIQKRCQYVTDLLAKPGRALEFSAQGWARIEQWTTRTNTGSPEVMSITQLGGRRAFHVRAGAAGVTTSWRADVILRRGLYRLEGRVKTKDFRPEPGDRRGGVGLRVLGRPLVAASERNSGWEKLTCDFEVRESAADVTLVCEFRGGSGEAWFDADSLRLVRR